MNPSELKLFLPSFHSERKSFRQVQDAKRVETALKCSMMHPLVHVTQKGTLFHDQLLLDLCGQDLQGAPQQMLVKGLLRVLGEIGIAHGRRQGEAPDDPGRPA